jgi:hypothetical protein
MQENDRKKHGNMVLMGAMVFFFFSYAFTGVMVMVMGFRGGSQDFLHFL